jgi:hypothetical protein
MLVPDVGHWGVADGGELVLLFELVLVLMVSWCWCWYSNISTRAGADVRVAAEGAVASTAVCWLPAGGDTDRAEARPVHPSSASAWRELFIFFPL